MATRAPTSKAFQRWFGGSVVVDEEGAPLVVYHGTDKGGFTVFDVGAGDGIFFTSSIPMAKSYTLSQSFSAREDPTPPLPSGGSGGAGSPGIYQVYLRIENPLILDAQGSKWDVISGYAQDMEGTVVDEVRRISTVVFAEMGRALGYDGVVILNVRDYAGGPEGPPGDIYVVFDSRQVKSATRNVGTFDFEDRDIRMNPSKAFQRWFGASKVVHKDGRPRVMYHGASAAIDEFSLMYADERSTFGQGFYFSNDEPLARQYAKDVDEHVVVAYLSLQNPFIIDYAMPFDERSARNRILRERGPGEGGARERLIAAGYDGVLVTEDDYVEAVAFYPTQIKAVDNVGTFDSQDPNIRRNPNGDEAEAVHAVQKALTPDLLQSRYRNAASLYAGHCYVASEALYHLLGGSRAGYTPKNLQHEGVQHWYLEGPHGVVDATADQFREPVPYHKGRGRGFLTKEPSKRAREVMARVGGPGRSNPGDNSNLRLTLLLPGENPAIGPESGRVRNSGIGKHVSPHGSVRYLYYLDGLPVAGLQVVTRDGVVATVANVYVEPAHRRQGLASALLERARQDFEVQHADEQHLSEDGKAWRDSRPNPSVIRSVKIKKGTLLYHGTSAEEAFEEDGGTPDGPAWFTDNPEVARFFQTWHGDPGDGRPRILVYRVVESIPDIAKIPDGQAFQVFLRQLERMGALEEGDGAPEELAEAMSSQRKWEGWRIIGNYSRPDGDDILLVSPERYLEFVGLLDEAPRGNGRGTSCR